MLKILCTGYFVSSRCRKTVYSAPTKKKNFGKGGVLSHYTFVEDSSVKLAAKQQNKVSSNFAAAINGQVSSTFAAAKAFVAYCFRLNISELENKGEFHKRTFSCRIQ